MNAQSAQGDAQNDGLIASDIPGRIRVRLRRGARSPEGIARLAEALRRRAGVDDVETNAQTGSVAVRYDSGRIEREEVLGVFRDMGFLVASVTKVIADDEIGGGSFSDDLVSIVEDLDSRLSRLTGQRVDLRFAVPLALGTIGVWRTVFYGLGVAEIPGFVWLWYSFDSFYKLNVQSHPSREHE
jgi:hypothetical protein